MRKNSIILVAATIVAVVLGSCSSGGNKPGETVESDEQIEQARMAAREAARPFVNNQVKDSLEITTYLVKAGSTRSKYEKLPRCRTAFDSTFISTVRTVNPQMAEAIKQRKAE